MEEYKLELFIENHRAMWNWIADEILELRVTISIPLAKYDWCDMMHLDPSAECFACECRLRMNIARNFKSYVSCKQGCLFNWIEGSEDFVGCVDCENSLYESCKHAKTYEEQAELARKIANMPVREEVVEFAKSLGM